MAEPSGERPLSPITELTTPRSLNTINLPHIGTTAEDYASEHEHEHVPSSPVDSLYSRASGDTILPVPIPIPTPITEPAAAPNQTPLPTCLLPVPPARSPRSAKRQPPPPLSPFPSLPLPIPPPPGDSSSIPSPRSLPPPPRPKGHSQRLTPPSSPTPHQPQPNEGGGPDRTLARYSLRDGVRLNQEGIANTATAETTAEHPGMAGVGAGGGNRLGAGGLRAGHRPRSFHATGNSHTPPMLGDIAIPQIAQQIPILPGFEAYSHDSALHNVPYISIPELLGSPAAAAASSPRASSPSKRSPPKSTRSRPSSISKRRPASLLKKRPHSYHGSRKRSPETLPDEIKTDIGDVGYQDNPQLLSPQTWTADELVGLDGTSPMSIVSRASPPRRRVSSIFSSIFSSGDGSETIARRFSFNRRRNMSRSSGMATRGSSPAISPITTNSSPEGINGIGEPPIAFRTSGTFGIRDDGSEMYDGHDGHAVAEEPVSPMTPMSFRQRTKSVNGSVQSLGVQRVLYAKNGDEMLTDDEQTPVLSSFAIAERERRGAIFVSSIHGTAFASPAASAPLGTRSPQAEPEGEGRSDQRLSSLVSPATPVRPAIGRSRRSYPPPSAKSAMFSPLQVAQSQGRPPTPPPLRAKQMPKIDDHELSPLSNSIAPSTDHKLAPVNGRSMSGFVSIVESAEMVDEAVQTASPSHRHTLPDPRTISRSIPSLLTIPTSPKSRSPRPASIPGHSPPLSDRRGSYKQPLPPLNTPPLPSASPSPLVSNSPFVERPNADNEPPKTGTDDNQTRGTGSPRRSTTSDLPLLIASHLLSTHAATLMRQSTTMRDVSEVMHRMARESLDWGGVLLGMSTREPPPTGYKGDAGCAGWDAQPTDTHPRKLYPQPPSEPHPLYQSWLNLHGQQSRPADLPFSDTSRFPPAPTDYTLSSHGQIERRGPSDRLTPPRERPSLLRARARQEMTSHVHLDDGKLWRSPSASQPHVQPQQKRLRPESLPADWLSEADRLGRQGWSSLRQAEEAWANAMTSLKAVVEEPYVIQGEEGVHQHDWVADEEDFTRACAPAQAHPQPGGVPQYTILEAEVPRPHKSAVGVQGVGNLDKPVTPSLRSKANPVTPAMVNSPSHEDPAVYYHPEDHTGEHGYTSAQMQMRLSGESQYPETFSTVADRDQAYSHRSQRTKSNSESRSTTGGETTMSLKGTRKLSKPRKQVPPLPPIPSVFSPPSFKDAAPAPESLSVPPMSHLEESTQSKRRGAEGKRHWWSRKRSGLASVPL